MRRTFLIPVSALVLLLGTSTQASEPKELPMPGDRMTAEQVEAFAKLAMSGISREYPNKPSQLMVGPESIKSPKDMHPVFYGCFDWHSAVHSHWALVRLLRLYPQAPIAATIRKTLTAQFTKEKLQAEADYFLPKHNRSFERTYGWAWALQLARELKTWDDADAKKWAVYFAPLETTLVALTKAFLPRMQWPLRSGLHIDSAFALSFFYDYAVCAKDDALLTLVRERAASWYGKDTDYPTRYEPSGFDFFSGGLNEADLMRRVLPPTDFAKWLHAFWPGLATGDLGNWKEPARPTDMEDGHLVHLVGLNLTRAWTLRGIVSALPAAHEQRDVLAKLAAVHAKAGLSQVFSGHYAGEHWLGSFAVYLLSDTGISVGR